MQPERLKAAFTEQFRKMTNADLDGASDPTIAKIRKDLADAFLTVTDQFKADMIKGGQDAFVPAFFRAELITISTRSLSASTRPSSPRGRRI